MGDSRKPSESFRAVKDIFDRERTETPAAGTRPSMVEAWQQILDVEADPNSSPGERRLARALRILLSRSHGP